MTDTDDLEFVNYAPEDMPLSLHIFGRKLDNSGVYVCRVRPDLDHTAFSVQATFHYMWAKEDAEFLGVIFCGRKSDGTLCYVHMFRNEPSPEDEEAKNNALLRIAVSGTGFITETDGAERAIEQTQFLAKELGFEFNSEQQ